MTRMTRNLGSLGILIAIATGSHAAAQTRTDRGWRVELTGLSTLSTTGSFGLESSGGLGLGLEYRISPRLGVELDVLYSELKDEITFGFFGEESLTIESSLRMIPVLAGLNVHLTPGRRADLYLGPVLGLMRYDDVEIELRGDILEGEAVPVQHLKTRDGFAWGARLGVDVPIGPRGAFFTASAAYLKAEVEMDGFEGDEIDDSDDFGSSSFDLDPFVTQVGFGYRF